MYVSCFGQTKPMIVDQGVVVSPPLPAPLDTRLFYNVSVFYTCRKLMEYKKNNLLLIIYVKCFSQRSWMIGYVALPRQLHKNYAKNYVTAF